MVVGGRIVIAKAAADKLSYFVSLSPPSNCNQVVGETFKPQMLLLTNERRRRRKESLNLGLRRRRRRPIQNGGGGGAILRDHPFLSGNRQEEEGALSFSSFLPLFS